MKIPDPLEDVLAKANGSSILEMQTGLFQLGRNRALQSGTTQVRPEDVATLENHARAMAKDTYRDLYDPAQNRHDAMHHAEYERTLAQREEAEQTRDHAAANLREAEIALALTPKAGPKPSVHPLLVAAFIATITLTVAPTVHDSIFHTLPDDMLAWFGALLSAAFVGAMLTWAILSIRRTKWTWIGVAAGVVLGLGLGAVRLSSAEGAGEVMFALGLTVVEIAAVLLLEGRASDLRASEADWLVRHADESEKVARRDAAQADLARWEARVQESNQAITKQIAFVEDRHNRHIHLPELEAVAIKAVLDGNNAGIAENIGRVRGVPGRTS